MFDKIGKTQMGQSITNQDGARIEKSEVDCKYQLQELTHGLMSSAEGMTFHIIISFSRMSSSSIIHTKWIRWRECVGGGSQYRFSC